MRFDAHDSSKVHITGSRVSEPFVNEQRRERVRPIESNTALLLSTASVTVLARDQTFRERILPWFFSRLLGHRPGYGTATVRPSMKYPPVFDHGNQQVAAIYPNQGHSGLYCTALIPERLRLTIDPVTRRMVVVLNQRWASPAFQEPPLFGTRKRATRRAAEPRAYRRRRGKVFGTPGDSAHCPYPDPHLRRNRAPGAALDA